MGRAIQWRPVGAWRLRPVAILATAMLALPAWSQAQPAATGDGAPSEAARRAAMSPFRMILQNADAARPKPVPVPAPVKKAAPVAAPAATAERPAPPATASASAARPAEAPVAAASAPEPQAEQVSVAAPTAQAAREPEPVDLVALKQDPPRLSAALRREQPQGMVKVAFTVRPDGSTGDVHVVRSTDRRLNTASVNAVTDWVFKPIGEPRPMEVELIYRDNE